MTDEEVNQLPDFELDEFTLSEATDPWLQELVARLDPLSDAELRVVIDSATGPERETIEVLFGYRLEEYRKRQGTVQSEST